MKSDVIQPDGGDFWATCPIETIRPLLDAIGTAVFVIRVDADGDFIVELVNRAYERVFGIPGPDIAGRRLADMLRPADFTRVAARYRRCIATGDVMEYDGEVVLQGRLLLARTTLTPCRAAGRVVRLIGTEGSPGDGAGTAGGAHRRRYRGQGEVDLHGQYEP